VRGMLTHFATTLLLLDEQRQLRNKYNPTLFESSVVTNNVTAYLEPRHLCVVSTATTF